MEGTFIVCNTTASRTDFPADFRQSCGRFRQRTQPHGGSP